MEPVNKSIDGMSFQITPFKAMKATILEKQVMAIFAPMILPLAADLTTGNLDKQVDFSKVASGFSSGFGKMSEAETENLILSLLSNVTYIGDRGAEMINREVFDRIFVGKLLVIYKLIWEVMKVNKFCFFDLLSGSGITITGLLNPQPESKKK